MNIRELFETIKNTAGTLDKKQLLKDNMSELLKIIFLDTYDTTKKYFVKKFNVTTTGSLTIDENYPVFRETLTKLSKRTITGNDAIQEVERVIGLFNKEDQEILINVINRNLKIGVSIDNFNDVCPVFTKFEVALAEPLHKVKNVNYLDGSYLASQKIDGCRCIGFINKMMDGGGDFVYEIVFKSRQGKTFYTLNNLVPHMIDLFAFHPEGKYVTDGEICIIDENGNESFKGIMKEVTRKDHTIKHPCYKWFDLLTLDEFEERKVSKPFSDRVADMCEMWYESGVDATFIDLLKQERIESQETFNKWSQDVIDNEWEGFMLRKDAPYKSGRSKDLLKVKSMDDAEYVVKDVVMGKATYNEGGSKEFDVASALVIEHKGNRVEVGSGLSKEQRLRWREHPEEIIGKTITVQYFEETTNQQGGISLRFPVLKYVYENGREV